MYKKTNYDYVKKCRALKRLKRDSSTSSKSSLESAVDSWSLKKKPYSIDRIDNLESTKTTISRDNSVCSIDSLQCTKSDAESNICSVDTLDSAKSNKIAVTEKSHNIKIEIECQDKNNLTLKEKLQDWCVNNIFTLRNSTTSQLLKILYSEGHDELPRTAETLLKTKKFTNETRIIKTAKLNNGLYTYFGIAEVLTLMIDPEIYNDDQIEILVNIDGMPIYKYSDKQFWPILMKIYHRDFLCKPGIVALYCGDSKPYSINEYMHDFVEETNKLMEICEQGTLFSSAGSRRYDGLLC
ncbi:uncharacterized protein LOC103317735 [Nasonia vitripennis]|uniref:Uncharacterized protein n=1 Tax=Nasonia vitripennis TaxID=7425 RepID=A0A7M7HFB3_NASVI|nr:uncharacterized protein LOC103317735 [Nasonia vitripennis]